MILHQSKNVAIIHQCSCPSNAIKLRFTAKLESRIRRAIEDMIEDEFINFILPIEYETSFHTIFIDIFKGMKKRYRHIRLVILLPYEKDERSCLSPKENMCYHTSLADEVIYDQVEYIPDKPSELMENLLRISGGVIALFDYNTPLLQFTVLHALHNSMPLAYINASHFFLRR